MYRFLKAEMVKADINVRMLSERIGISEKSIRNKINGNTDFTLQEALRVRDIVNPSLEMEKLFQADEPIEKKEVV